MNRIACLAAFGLLLTLVLAPGQALATDENPQRCTYQVCVYDADGDGWEFDSPVGRLSFSVLGPGFGMVTLLWLPDESVSQCSDFLVSDGNSIGLDYRCSDGESCEGDSWELIGPAGRSIFLGSGEDSDTWDYSHIVDCHHPVGGFAEPQRLFRLVMPWLALATLGVALIPLTARLVYRPRA